MPGQFVVLRVNEQGERIPLTVADTMPDKGILVIVFQEAGKSTKLLGTLNEGDKILDLIGSSQNLKPLASKDYLKTRFTTGNKRIAIIHDYLMKHYREEVNLQNLAEAVNMAEGSLCRFFKQNMGITLFEYLHKIKVEFACKLLMDGDLSVLDVCLDSGFNNVSHFNRKFRQITGITPREYRDRIKNLT